MWKQTDVEIFGVVDQFLDGTAIALRMADEELRMRCSCANANKVSAKSPPLDNVPPRRPHAPAPGARPGGPTRLQGGLFHVAASSAPWNRFALRCPLSSMARALPGGQTDQDAPWAPQPTGDTLRDQVTPAAAGPRRRQPEQGQLAQFGEHAGSPIVTSGGASTTSISSASCRNFSGTLERARFPVKARPRLAAPGYTAR